MPGTQVAAKPVVHVIGAGMAGLSAALHLAEDHRFRVILHEATAHAGGLCRSYHDSRLDRLVDTGSHLILSGNSAVLDHAARIGATDRLQIGAPEFAFFDRVGDTRWTLRLPRGPLGALSRGSRPPGTALKDLPDMVRLVFAGSDSTLAETIRRRGPLWRALWQPLCLGVLNAPPEAASARLMRHTLALTFLRGTRACRPVFAPLGLGPALVDPAVARLKDLGATFNMRQQLAAIEQTDNQASALTFSDGTRIALAPRDQVVLAVPPDAQAALLPGVPAPGAGLTILNAHFRVAPELAQAIPPLLGLLGGAGHWVFRRDDVLSVTISAAETSPLDGLSSDASLERLWSEVAHAAGFPMARPLASRLVRMRAATFDQSPQSLRQRPATRSLLRNLMVAGAQVDNGLPCTLESAITSGATAAAAILSQRPRA
ncbi:hydroxysqualene dehydroxylase HpnE [Pseudooceanicola algae]|uniref:Hydroxysqualene dehydroxylase n=1 Tax=Pseudooceanicola algae TaxID=1537215 RepID=A0A418SIB0_9RHOB|nr:hydroxysqualene dehydroxylase HpnE [Pseudooceanicola algae]QPM88987.1 Hydroxysqualene dehydroxylase [Pseudooceanicola algae]